MDLHQKKPIIDRYIHQKLPVYLISNGINAIFQSRILARTDKFIKLVSSIPYDYVTKFMLGDQFYIQMGMHRFISGKIDTEGKFLLFQIDTLEHSADNRTEQRLFFDESEEVYTEILNPYDNETILRKIVIEMSSSGLSFKTTLNSKLFEPDTIIDKIKIVVGNKTYNEHTGLLVYKRLLFSESGKKHYQIGVKFMTQQLKGDF